MQKQFTVLVIFLSALITGKSFAQGVGINNPAPASSSILDIASSSKGLLIPRMTSAQRIAISSPATGLMVYETTTNQFFYFDGIVWKPILSNSAGWNISGNAGTIAGTNFIGTTDNADLVMKTAAIEKMRILANGNVGIGTAAPANKLHVSKSGLSGITPDVSAVVAVENNSTGYLNILTPSTNENGILFGIGGGSGASANCGGIIFNSASTKRGFQFRTDGNSIKMVLDSNGKAGIGTTFPVAKLDVFVPTANDTIIYRGRNGSSDGTISQIGSIETFHDYANTIDFDGGSSLTVNWGGPASTAASLLMNNNTIPMFLVNGNAQKPGGGSWTAISDERLKNDINPFKDGLETLEKINPIYYKYNGKCHLDSNNYYVGVIAQDLQKTAPYMVASWDYAPNPKDVKNVETYLNVDNSALTYILVNAVKELNSKIEVTNHAVKTISDLGVEEMKSGNEQTVNFSDDFISSLQNGKLPVVTVTPVNSNIQVSVKNINSTGFTIVTNTNAQGLSVNWIAAAKVSTAQFNVSKNYPSAEREQMMSKVQRPNSKFDTRAEDAEMAKRIQAGEIKQ